jgi:hypothetical protein
MYVFDNNTSKIDALAKHTIAEICSLKTYIQRTGRNIGYHVDSEMLMIQDV